jgi:GNAT superfamily N-acetyltransferase
MDTEVRPLTSDDTTAAVGVLARGMRDNPNHVAVWGDDPEFRVQALTGFMGVTLPLAAQAVGAVRGGELVGVCGIAPPGQCIGDVFRALGGEVPSFSEDAGEQARIAEWLTAWATRDPGEPHWHLGPLAADLPLQRQGIGTVLMERFCSIVDAAGDAAYLETDKPENVGFYERFDFETVGEVDVVGVHNWFMRRPAP